MEQSAAEPRSDDPIEAFIARWTASSAAERANFQPFAMGLASVLGVDPPEPATGDPARDRYGFEYPVKFANPTSTGFIDLYKRDAFVMEAKQGSDQQLEKQLALFGGSDSQARKGTAVRGTRNCTAAMQRARGQAERYAKELPVDHGWPPFLIIVDVGHCFELYADFTRTGKSYSQFPDAQSFPAQQGLVISNLSVGVDLDAAMPLQANEGLCSPGVKLHGAGFMVSPEHAKRLGLGSTPGLDRRIRPYRHGRDLTYRPRGVMVIDLDGLKEADVREQYPAVYHHVLTHVYPERKHNNERYRRDNWWLFGRNNAMLRAVLQGLPRYITTVETTKHRVFQFLDEIIVLDNMLVNFALDDAFFLGVLSSRIHVTWTLAIGGTLENRPRYNKTRCFDPFPFPNATNAQRQIIRDLAEQLDAYRKRVLATHEELTLTELYNVLERLRAGEALTPKEQGIHERGLVSVIKHLHDEIDAAVLDAYGWPRDLSDEDILGRLVELNKERRAEEARGLVRWLRPEYQAPAAKTIVVKEQGQLDITRRPSVAAGARRASWPKTLPERITGIRGLLAAQPKPAHAEELARRFHRAPRGDVQEVLNALVALGLARRLDDNRYAP